VLFLIFSFFNVAALSLLFNFEFLSITFLVVYVGAVAVLFLFVLMMLNIKLAELLEVYYNVAPVGVAIAILFIYQLLFLLRFEFEVIETLDYSSMSFLFDFSTISKVQSEFFDLYGSFSNIKTLAFALFSDFLFHFIISGMVLLLAMIAAIVLTLQKQFISKTQNVYNQILKDFNVAITSAS
jgi:NADH-quinone oxidoreductase subunit J